MPARATASHRAPTTRNGSAVRATARKRSAGNLVSAAADAALRVSAASTALELQQPLDVAAADRSDRLSVEPGAAHVADGIVVRHVEGIVGAHEDVAGAVEPH